MFVYSEPYDLTKVPGDLPGPWYTLLNSNGWIAVTFFILALIIWYQFRAWAFRRVTEWEKSGKPMPNPVVEADEETGSEVGDETEIKIPPSNTAKVMPEPQQPEPGA